MIHILTDGISDIKPQEALKMEVQVLPLHIHFENEYIEDILSINEEEFYRRLAVASKLPKTSQVTPEAFYDAYVQALERKDEVLVITGSSELSGTFQSAMIARDMLSEEDRERVYLVDSQSASLGEAMLVYEAVRLRAQGEEIRTIQKAILTLIPHQVLVGFVEDLKYLVMGGRLSSVGAKVGTMLRIKPMLRLRDGKLDMAGIARGTRNAYDWLLQQLKQTPPDLAYPVHIASAHASEALEELKSHLIDRGGLTGMIRTMGIGPATGTHTGPGCLVISWISKAIRRA